MRARPCTFLRLLTIAAAFTGTSTAAAQETPAGRPLSLSEALARAAMSSEAIAVARGGVTGAQGQRMTARAQRLPQINSNFSYQRTLISQFGGGGSSPDTTSTPVVCTPFVPDPSLPLEERVARVEQALLCPPAPSGFGDIDISRAGFGNTNAYNLGFSLTQSLYSGGRISAQNEAANAALISAELEVTAQSAQLVVDAAQSYFDALLSVRLLQIAESSLAQAEETLRLSELGFRVGDKAEYDVLRARVARNNQRNAVVQATSNRDLAFFRLKQLLDLPLDEPVRLTTPLTDEAPPPDIAEWLPEAASDTAAAARVSVRQAEQTVEIQEAQVQIAESQRKPNVDVVSNYGLSAFPQEFLPAASDVADNLTVGLQVAFPIFDGGRLRGGVIQARGTLEQARAQLARTRENAVLDARTRIETLETARATLAAMQGSVEEAQRAYEIAQLRYQQGIASLIEVNDARLALSQAQADRAQATRNVFVARIQLMLVRDLPLGGSTTLPPASPSAGGSTAPAPNAPAGQPAGRTTNIPTGIGQ